MSLFTLNLETFGIDISDLSIKVAAVYHDLKGRLCLRGWNEVALEAGIIEQGLIKQPDKLLVKLQEVYEQAHGSIQTDFVVASLPDTKTFMKRMVIEKEIGKDVSQSELIESQLPKEIPLPIENIHYDFEVIAETEETLEVLVGAAPREIVLSYSDILRQASYKTVALEIEAQAIIRALLAQSSFRLSEIGYSQPKINFAGKLLHLGKKSRKSKVKDSRKITSQPGRIAPLLMKDGPKLLVDVGATRTGTIVFHKGTIQLTRTLELSGEDLTKSLVEKLKLSKSKAEQTKKISGLEAGRGEPAVVPLAQEWFNNLLREMKDTIGYYLASLADTAVKFEQLILSGGGAAMPGLAARLQQELAIPVVTGNPIKDFQIKNGGVQIPDNNLPGMVTAIGLSRRGFTNLND